MEHGLRGRLATGHPGREKLSSKGTQEVPWGFSWEPGGGVACLLLSALGGCISFLGLI